MTDASVTHVESFCIAPTHPSLAGHFPGHPIVPGVVLLDHVQQATQRWLGRKISLKTLSQAKFLAPLLPEQSAQIELKLMGEALRFSILRGQQLIAQGTLTLATGIDPEPAQ